MGNFDDFVRYYGGFVQDDFRITPKLTLNLGLRFEFESGVQEERNRIITGFNTTVTSPLSQPGFPIVGGVEYAGVGGNPTQTGNPLSVKPGPRIGFAYAPDSKTVIRGGYGIYWVPTFFSYQNAIGYSQTTSINASTNGNYTPAVSLSNPYPNGLLQPTGNTLGLASGVGQAITVFSPSASSAGYSQHYSLEVQRQFPYGFVISAWARWIPTASPAAERRQYRPIEPLRTIRLGVSALSQIVANPLYGNGGVGTLATAKVSALQLLLPFPQYTSVSVSNANTAASYLLLFYVRAERRFSNGLSMLASYTWSRSKDDITGASAAGASNITQVAGPAERLQPDGEWSLSTQDVPNRFTMSATYELPFGKGKKYLQRQHS